MKNIRLSASALAALLVFMSPLASGNSGNADVADEVLFSNTSQHIVKKARSNTLDSNVLTSVISPRKSPQSHQATQQLIHVSLPSDNKAAQ